MIRLLTLLICLYALPLCANEYRYLDDLALKAGADKASSYHNYIEVYARYFAPLREQPIKFLEIGIYRGNSVRLWEEYFKNAELHFIDITLGYCQYSPQRAHYHLADQESPEQLQRFIGEAGGNFDVIIDDGGHTMNQQITSFKVLFPHLKKGGIYVIEDLHTSYWLAWPGGTQPLNTVNFLKSLIDDVNFIGYRTGCASHLRIPPELAGEMSLYREQILSIHFYDSMAVILKR